MEKIFYVCFEVIINNNMCFEIIEYNKGVMGSMPFEGTRKEFKKMQLRAKAHKNLIEKELI